MAGPGLLLMSVKVDSVTLAYQQAAVLRNNIDQNVAHFFGAMGTDLWDRQVWEEHLQQNMVIVCTAEILNQCLLNSHVRMNQINLLIFDEAHHTKKDHPYARFVMSRKILKRNSDGPLELSEILISKHRLLNVHGSLE